MSEGHDAEGRPAAGGPGAPHTYVVQHHQMRVGSPLTLPAGERIVAVLSSEQDVAARTYGHDEVIVYVLVELP